MLVSVGDFGFDGSIKADADKEGEEEHVKAETQPPPRADGTCGEHNAAPECPAVEWTNSYTRWWLTQKQLCMWTVAEISCGLPSEDCRFSLLVKYAKVGVEASQLWCFGNN